MLVRALPRVVATMDLSDSRFGHRVIMDSHALLSWDSPHRASQVPVLIFQCPPSSVTPLGRIAAIARCFAVRVGFALSGGLATQSYV